MDVFLPPSGVFFFESTNLPQFLLLLPGNEKVQSTMIYISLLSWRKGAEERERTLSVMADLLIWGSGEFHQTFFFFGWKGGR